MHNLFRRFAQTTSAAVGSPWAFALAVMAIVVWALHRPLGRVQHHLAVGDQYGHDDRHLPDRVSSSKTRKIVNRGRSNSSWMS